MFVTSLHLKQFRCFSAQTIAFDGKLVLIEGPNGVGKSSLLEALHYACYLRSFRTHVPRELVSFDTDAFFIKVSVRAEQQGGELHTVQVGFAGKKRAVKVDGRPVRSFADLMQYLRVVTVTEDDVQLIKGGPELRRTFIDQALVLHQPAYVDQLKTFKQVLENRNALLHAHGRFNEHVYAILTEQLWRHTHDIQQVRMTYLAAIQAKTNILLHEHIDDGLAITVRYQPRKMDPAQAWENFEQGLGQLQPAERRMGRSLFGAHLDDIVIEFQRRRSRAYASRGQQKLTVLLLKIAQLQELAIQKGAGILLIDDFMTDFDDDRIERLLGLLMELPGQVIVTSPTRRSFFENRLVELGAQRISLQ